MDEKIQKKLTVKIEALKHRLSQLNTEIVNLDTQLGFKRREFIKVEGIVEGFQAVLNEINSEVSKEIEKDDETK